jgi:L-histidine Nalpha-methyltransferase
MTTNLTIESANPAIVATEAGSQRQRDLQELHSELFATPRSIPTRLLYDERGSGLFERICELPEYYQTRTEHAILAAQADRIVELTAAEELVEIGSGAAVKTRLLLDAMQRAGSLRRYVQVDLAEGTMRRVAAKLTQAYAGLAVEGIVADFNSQLDRPRHACRQLVIFLGGTIGNLYPDQALRFLRMRRNEMEPGDHFLLGVDLVKPVAQLEAAYNDSQGVTAEFNRNILRVVNRLAEADFDPSIYRHRAFYDPARRWIEMRLVATRRQRVNLGAYGLILRLHEGEEIRTEISAKYDREQAGLLLQRAGLSLREWFTDPEQRFGLALARRP